MHRFLNFAPDSHKARPDIFLRTIGTEASERMDERVEPMRSVDTNITSEDLNIPLEISSRLQLRALLVKFVFLLWPRFRPPYLRFNQRPRTSRYVN